MALPKPARLLATAERRTHCPTTVHDRTERIHATTGTGNRGAASLFAVQHGLLPVE